MLKDYLRKIGLSKPKSSLVSSSTRKESCHSVSSHLNVSEEYHKVLRTSSYTDIVTKVQTQLRRTSMDQLLSSSSSLSIPFYVRLSDFLLEPRQEQVMNVINGFDLHQLLIDYFDASLEAANMYELILHGIFKARSNHRFITRALRAAGHDEEYTDDQCQTIIEKLSLFASLSNPMATISLDQFGDFRDRFLALQHELTSKVANIKMRLKLFSFSKRVNGYTLLDLPVHNKTGGRSMDKGAFPRCRAAGAETKRSRSMTERKPRGSKLERLYMLLDLAKKGTYILLNEFATLQMLANSIDGKVEHRKLVADLCVGNSENRAVLREGIRELSTEEEEFLEQLDELEDHVYLCFSTVNRSRKLVINEIMASQ